MANAEWSYCGFAIADCGFEESEKAVSRRPKAEGSRKNISDCRLRIADWGTPESRGQRAEGGGAGKVIATKAAWKCRCASENDEELLHLLAEGIAK